MYLLMIKDWLKMNVPFLKWLKQFKKGHSFSLSLKNQPKEISKKKLFEKLLANWATLIFYEKMHFSDGVNNSKDVCSKFPMHFYNKLIGC